MPPMEPSQVFLGRDVRGERMFADSAADEVGGGVGGPGDGQGEEEEAGAIERKPWIRTAKERGKATRKSALEEIPAEGRDSTRGRRVKRVSTVRPRRKRKKRVVGE